MNSFTTLGRITNDLELKELSTGDKVINFSIAENYGKDKTNFFSCVAYGNKAEMIAKYFVKGALIAISGSFKTEEYVDKNTNQNRRNLKLIVNQAGFTGEKRDDTNVAYGRMPEAKKQELVANAELDLSEYADLTPSANGFPF